MHDYDWIEAGRQFQLAMASPSVPAEAHWAYAALYLSVFGRFEESTAEMRRAVEQDPLSVLWRGILMGHLVCAGKYEEALDEGMKALDIAKNEMHPHMAFGEAYLALGRVAEAVAAAERAHRNLPQQAMGTGLLAASLVRLGEKDRAEVLLREMGDSPVPIWGRAWYHLLCSEIDTAASLVRKDDRGARDVRPRLCQFSLHRGTAGQSALGQAGAHDESARSERLNPASPARPSLAGSRHTPLADAAAQLENRRMPVLRLALILALLTGIDSTNTQRASPDRPGTAADTPATDHAVGYYDERLQRVVLVGGAGDPKPGDRDKVWSWSGTRWERVTDEGPPAGSMPVRPMTPVAEEPSLLADRGRRTGQLGGRRG